MEYGPALTALLDEHGRASLTWKRGGRVELVAVTGLDDDGQLVNVPVTDPAAIAEATAIVDGLIENEPMTDEIGLHLEPGAVAGAAVSNEHARSRMVSL